MARQVHKYDLDGNYIRSYETIVQAAHSEAIDESSIRKACTGITQTCNHKLWSYHRRASIYDVDTIDNFITSQNIPPEEVTKTKIYETQKGEVRVSVETRRSPELTEDQLRAGMLLQSSRQLQHKTDLLRVLRKESRESARVENTLTELNSALITILSGESFIPLTYEHPSKEGTVLLVQLSDLHFNELVKLPDNLYGFEIGAKRLQKYAGRIRKLARVYDTTQIVLALTGDLINSDRRLDEMMNQATNRMKASVIATKILYHFIQDINRDCNVKIVSVSGNESRVKDEYGMSEILMSDNYDFLIFNMLKLIFGDSKGVEFIEGDPVEQVLNINNSNILISHGTSIREGQQYMQQVFGKYAAKGILLDYAIFGHVHFTNITDIYSRSGSLVGNNVYSDRSLNLVTKASQTAHIIERDGSIDSVRISLQYYEPYKGYDIKDDTTAYNSVLPDNIREKTTIVQIVI